jgi:hypothetical protein
MRSRAFTRVCPKCRELALSPGRTECAVCEFYTLHAIPPKIKPESVVMVVPLEWFNWIGIIAMFSLAAWCLYQLFS